MATKFLRVKGISIELPSEWLKAIDPELEEQDVLACKNELKKSYKKEAKHVAVSHTDSTASSARTIAGAVPSNLNSPETHRQIDSSVPCL